MSAASISKSARIELSPHVAAILEGESQDAALGRLFLRFSEALVDADGTRIDGMTPFSLTPS